MFKKYSSISGYLERFTLFKIGKLHVRVHHILSADGTIYCHNHPFHYISIILKGGYVEQIIEGDRLIEKKHQRGSIIVRCAQTHHRIKEATHCTTLFLAWGKKQNWSLKSHPNIECSGYQKPTENGVYLRTINSQKLYCKFDEFWFIGANSVEKALIETRLSIYQVGEWQSI